MRVRFSGFGGQGVVLCGFIFGKAAMLDGKNSMQTQSYGSASRGGLTKSDVGIESGIDHFIHPLETKQCSLIAMKTNQICDVWHFLLGKRLERIEHIWIIRYHRIKLDTSRLAEKAFCRCGFVENGFWGPC